MQAHEFPVVSEIKREDLCNIVTFEDKEYEDSRKCWNSLINKYPLAIVQPTSSTEISKLLTICQKHKQKATIKGGGKSSFIFQKEKLKFNF